MQHQRRSLQLRELTLKTEHQHSPQLGSNKYCVRAGMRNANFFHPRLIVRVRGNDGRAKLGKLRPCSLIPYKNPSRPVHSIVGVPPRGWPAVCVKTYESCCRFGSATVYLLMNTCINTCIPPSSSASGSRMTPTCMTWHQSKEQPQRCCAEATRSQDEVVLNARGDTSRFVIPLSIMKDYVVGLVERQFPSLAEDGALGCCRLPGPFEDTIDNQGQYLLNYN